MTASATAHHQQHPPHQHQEGHAEEHFKEGDRVLYRPVGHAMQTTVGIIKKVLTEPEPAGTRGNVAKASEEEPRYVIYNEHTGKETPYKRENILERVDE